MISKGQAVVAAMFLALPAPRTSHACLPEGLLSITVAPECPSAADSTTVYVFGAFPDLCWTPLTLDSSDVDDTLIAVYASAAHSGSGICFAMPVMFDLTVTVGHLSPATAYDVVVTVRIDTGKFAGTYVCESSFSVDLVGDTNGNGLINSADIILLLNHVFKSGPPPCGGTGDVNCDGFLNSADVIFLVNHVFKSGPPPVAVCASSQTGFGLTR